jgi:hypothetical protein
MYPAAELQTYLLFAIRSKLQASLRTLRVAFQIVNQYYKDMPERTQKPPAPAPWEPKQGDGDGPRSPDVSKPDTKDLLKRMRKVDPNQSKRYRQRTGQ